MHTKEPWRADGDAALSSEHQLIAIAFRTEAQANARRIVAAVNAATGISTEALESGAVAELISHQYSSVKTLLGCIEHALSDIVRAQNTHSRDDAIWYLETAAEDLRAALNIASHLERERYLESEIDRYRKAEESCYEQARSAE